MLALRLSPILTRNTIFIIGISNLVRQKIPLRHRLPNIATLAGLSMSGVWTSGRVRERIEFHKADAELRNPRK
jgi:hypothetical protein